MPFLRSSRLVLSLTAMLMTWSQPHYFLASASISVDKVPECEELAEKGDCRNPANMDFMLKNCAASCEKQPGVRKVEVMPIGEDEPQFFELSAEDVHGNILDFEEFEGYITLLVNCARICGVTEQYYTMLEHMHEVWPYTLEILAFPFWKSDSQERPECPSHKEADLRKGRKIHVMKEVELNGPNAHPVYQFLKKKFNQETIDESYATFFLINPDGNLVEAHFGTSPSQLKLYIQKHLKEDLAGRAKISEL